MTSKNNDLVQRLTDAVMVCVECNPQDLLAVYAELKAALRAALAVQGEAVAREYTDGRWHHGNGYLCMGTLRVARADFDTNPSADVQAAFFDEMCAVLNAHPAPSAAPAWVAEGITMGKTARGFALAEFTDYYGHGCSLQKSSLAEVDCIWLGIDDAKPEILASKTPQGGTGWVPYPIPDDVSLHTRMHLSQEQVRCLLPMLQHFAEHGELPPAPTADNGEEE